MSTATMQIVVRMSLYKNPPRLSSSFDDLEEAMAGRWVPSRYSPQYGSRR